MLVGVKKMFLQALRIVLNNSNSNLQALEQEFKNQEFKGKVLEMLTNSIEETKQAHALLEDYIKRMEEKDANL